MQTIDRNTTREAVKSFARQFGYALSIGINIVLIWVAHNMVDWGWPSFITEDWTRVRGLVEASLLVSIIANLAYIASDPKWVRGLGEATTNLVSVIATIRLLTVYPFDFSAYDGPWDVLTKFILVMVIVGTVVGFVANIGKAAKNL